MHHLRAHAFGESDAHPDPHHDHRSLYTFTAILGVLIGGDLVLGWLGWELIRAPWGISLAWVAAILGAGRIVYGAIEALARGRIGADIALAQACLAAIIIGQPFVAAEVVFIALVGEVLEAVTFDADPEGKSIACSIILRDQRQGSVATAEEIEIPVAQVVAGDVVLVRAGERVPVDGPVLSGRSIGGRSIRSDGRIDAGRQGGRRRGFHRDRQPVRPPRSPGRRRVGHESTLGASAPDGRRRSAPQGPPGARSADRYARYFLPVVEVGRHPDGPGGLRS